MLDRAVARLQAAGLSRIEHVQADVRETEFPPQSFDAILATAVLHHLREDHEWEGVFAKLRRWLKPGGAVWIFDLIRHEIPQVQEILWNRYGEYLEGLGGEEYRLKVFSYIDLEDSPRTLTEQLDWLRKAGFERTEILHKNGCFAAFAGFHRGKP
jgi:tRNA (cmo5U34)-methyltransferase